MTSLPSGPTATQLRERVLVAQGHLVPWPLGYLTRHRALTGEEPHANASAAGLPSSPVNARPDAYDAAVQTDDPALYAPGVLKPNQPPENPSNKTSHGAGA